MKKGTHRLGGDVLKWDGRFTIGAFRANPADIPVGTTAAGAVIDMICVIKGHESARPRLSSKSVIANMHRHDHSFRLWLHRPAHYRLRPHHLDNGICPIIA